MREPLSDEQKLAVEAGELRSPSGVVYRRGTTRLSRKAVDSLIAAGVPLVEYWPGGLLEHTALVWRTESDAREAWARTRSSVTTGVPRPKGRRAAATVGAWTGSDSSQIALLTWHH